MNDLKSKGSFTFGDLVMVLVAGAILMWFWSQMSSQTAQIEQLQHDKQTAEIQRDTAVQMIDKLRGFSGQ